jgi:hypothetical protein
VMYCRSSKLSTNQFGTPDFQAEQLRLGELGSLNNLFSLLGVTQTTDSPLPDLMTFPHE